MAVPWWTVTVLGDPKAQPRVRAFRRGKHASVYTPATADLWKRAVSDAVFRQVAGSQAIGDAIRITMVFRMPRPKRLRQQAKVYHIAKPDADNLAKAVCDAITATGAWNDDSQVAELLVVKRYAKPGQPPSMLLKAELLSSEDLDLYD